ncbi:hypothetical protein HBH70_123240 [Parastagonospora nodorum]|nr:hypothetical protein HBH42_155090 [Parastagonospora nodorum]KAH4901600.1 hypothetical protein HBI80_146590 [Parastagonospora nodorum]KAH5064929.1 hypothetical protein HBI73_201270 [Parastagonospora nodorum]KAH5075978.1 hypothetical protein HBH95_123670 [Parastagonospora nodorum]KAH5135816.1 hypothetical protein HBH70_123240 [Parastagonospora nodorum]
MGVALSFLQDAIASLSSAIALLGALSNEFNQALHRASLPPGLPVPRFTRPYWIENPPFPDLVNAQSSALPKIVDVAIIGSGIAGAATARSILHERRRRGVDTAENVVVLEARELCSGATARNGGHIKASPYEAFHMFSQQYSKERAVALTRFQMRHLKCLVDLCKSEGIEGAEAREVETVDIFLDDVAWKKALKDVDEMRKWMPGIEIKTWEGNEAQEKFGVNEGVVGAFSYTAGAIWAYRFTVSIWERLLNEFPKTLAIETNTPVESISVPNDAPSNFPYAVQTARGTVFARHVVHATNGFASQLVPGLRKKIVGARAHMSAQAPGLSFPRCNGMRSWSVIYNGGFDYISQRPSTPEEAQGDVMLGGGFMRSSKQGVDQLGIYDDGAALDPLTVSHIAGIFPAVFHPKWGAGAELKNAWSGILGMTGDLVPFVGRLDGRLTQRDVKSKDGAGRRGEWIAAGWCGEGMIWAWLCGTGLGIMIAGSENDDVEETSGRPGGRLADWFPDELRVSVKRLRSADVANLANRI